MIDGHTNGAQWTVARTKCYNIVDHDFQSFFLCMAGIPFCISSPFKGDMVREREEDRRRERERQRGREEEEVREDQSNWKKIVIYSFCHGTHTALTHIQKQRLNKNMWRHFYLFAVAFVWCIDSDAYVHPLRKQLGRSHIPMTIGDVLLWTLNDVRKTLVSCSEVCG